MILPATRILAGCGTLAFSLLLLERRPYDDLLGAPDGLAVRASILVVLLGKTLAAMLPGVVTGCVLAALGRPRAGERLAFGWGVAILLWLSLEAAVRGVTGNPISFYLSFLGEDEAIAMGGPIADLLGDFAPQLARIGLLMVASATAAITIARGLTLWLTPRRAVPVLVCLASAWVLVAGGSLAVQRLVPAPFTFARLDDALPFSWNAGFAQRGSVFDETQRRARALYDRHFAAVNSYRTPPRGRLPARSGERPPNVVLIVADSLRADALTPEKMPRLWRWAERGTRLESHTSTSNGSAGGLFTLVTGWYSRLYQHAILAEVPVPATTILGRLGYRSHFFTSGSFQWRNLDVIFGPPNFTKHPRTKAVRWEADRKSVADARALLDSSRDPLFLFVFVMSTHFRYPHPPEYADLDPEVPPLPPAQTALRKSYLRSVRFMDDLIGGWVEELDPNRNVVIVTGDHGEALGDDGTMFHASRLSVPQLRVPLVIAGPGVPARSTIRGETDHTDVVPTILDLAGVPPRLFAHLHGNSWFSGTPGRSYAAAVNPPGIDGTPPWIALRSGERGFQIRLHPRKAVVEFGGRLDEHGLPTGEELTPSDSAAFLGWFEEFLLRSGRSGLASGAAPRRAGP